MVGYTKEQQKKVEEGVRLIVSTLGHPLSDDLTGILKLSLPFQQGQIAGTIWIETVGKYPRQEK